MKSLSGLDATFLYLETPETPMHVGSFNLYELPKGSRGSFHRAVKQHLAKRMHLAPIFSRRLAFMPLDLGHPTWVDADAVDLDFHVRKVPGRQLTVRQAEAMAARLHGQLIDREHPLWEFHIFDNIRPPAGMDIEGRLVGIFPRSTTPRWTARAARCWPTRCWTSAPPRVRCPPPTRRARSAPPANQRSAR